MRSLVSLILLTALCTAHAPRGLNEKQKARLSHARTQCSKGVNCILTKEATEGPFYVVHPLVRSNITEDRDGIPMELTINVLNVSNCSPLPGVFVDIWHADAMGEYSGWASTHLDASFELMKRGNPIEDSRWLRGVQETDENGIAKFNTVMPGWYHGRCTHIHIRIHTGNVSLDDGVLLGDGQTAHTGQLFFDNNLVTEISKTREPYKTHRKQLAPKLNEEDGIYLHSDGGEQKVSIEEENAVFHGSITVGIDPDADHEEEPFPGRPPHGRPGHRPPHGEPPSEDSDSDDELEEPPQNVPEKPPHGPPPHGPPPPHHGPPPHGPPPHGPPPHGPPPPHHGPPPHGPPPPPKGPPGPPHHGPPHGKPHRFPHDKHGHRNKTHGNHTHGNHTHGHHPPHHRRPHFIAMLSLASLSLWQKWSLGMACLAILAAVVKYWIGKFRGGRVSFEQLPTEEKEVVEKE